MKKIIILILALCASARATLIDLTPGGFNVANGFPPVYDHMFQTTFFDEAAHGFFAPPPVTYDGWVSLYGYLNGGTYFFTDLFGHDTPTASVSWNLTGEPGGYWMSYIFLEGRASDNTSWSHIYSVPWSFRFTDPGELVALHEGVNIRSISFFGTNIVPETGSTLLLLIIGWAILAPAGSLLFGHFWRKKS